MKLYTYLLFLIIIIFGCNENPSDLIKDSILSESKSISEGFVYNRASIENIDTLSITMETQNPDIYLFLNFLKERTTINLFSSTLLQIDTPSISNAMFNVTPDYTEILWSTAYEINNMGFEIQRKDSNESYNKVGFVNGYGTSTEIHHYSFKDYNSLSQTYFYRLKQIDFNGSYEYSLEAKIEVEATDSIKAEFSLTADNGVILYSGEIAPESGYAFNLPFSLNDLIYFRNSLSHFGKIKIQEFNFLGDHFLNIGESYKNISYNLKYEVFLQTNGTRTFY